MKSICLKQNGTFMSMRCFFAVYRHRCNQYLCGFCIFCPRTWICKRAPRQGWCLPQKRRCWCVMKTAFIQVFLSMSFVTIARFTGSYYSSPRNKHYLQGAHRPGQAPHDIVIPVDERCNLIVNFVGPWNRMQHNTMLQIYHVSEDRDAMEFDWQPRFEGKNRCR